MSWLFLSSAFAVDQVRAVPRDGTLAEVLGELESQSGDHVIWVTEDVDLEPTTLSAITWDDLVIRGVGDPQIHLAGSGVMLELASPAQLLIRDLRIDGSDAASLLTATQSADIELHNVVVERVLSTGDGSAIAMTGSSATLRVDGCTFSEGTAEDGGFIHVDSPNATIEIVGSEFLDGSASGAGGALHAVGGEVHIHSSQFYANDAQSGGAIHIAAATAVEIDDCRFVLNTSAAGVSAVELTALLTPETAPAEVRSTLFRQNDGLDGAVRLDGPASAYRLTENRFCQNTADSGAAIHASALVQQRASYFWQNTADEDGGALWVASGTFTDVHSTYRSNVASRGEAVHANGIYSSQSAVVADHQNATTFDGSGPISLVDVFSKDNPELNHASATEVQRLWFRSEGCGFRHARLRCNSIDAVDLAGGRDPGAMQGCSEDDEADTDGLSRAVEQALGTDPALPDTDGDGRSDHTECPPLPDLLSNGAFQYSGQATQGGDGWRYLPNSEIPGWTWTPGGQGELRQPGYSFDDSLDTACTIDTAVTYAEIHPDAVAVIHQDVQLVAGQTVRIGFETIRRNPGDRLTLEVGPFDGTFTVVRSDDYTATEDWVHHFIDYTPTTDDPTRIQFRSLQSTGDTVSASIDNVTVIHRPDFDGDGVIDCLDDDADDDGAPDLVDPDPRNPDTDGDGFDDGIDLHPTLADIDGDGVHVPDGDCDDLDPTISPNLAEDCSSIDRNCDGDPTHGAMGVEALWPDEDGDGFGDQGVPAENRCPEPGWVSNNTDCDDGNAHVYFGATEVCDGDDNDCDDEVDEGLGQTWYEDEDEDGFGNPAVAVMQCDQPDGFVEDDNDCDDELASTNPGATEICNNGEDDDCNGVVDTDATDVDWYPDDDGDGFGDENAAPFHDCAPPDDGLYVAGNNEDCDDESPEIAPGVPEVCDGVDQDCDALEDEDPTDGVLSYVDDDGDTYGDPNQPVIACEAPPNTVDNDDDCNDSQSDVHPGASEICDGIDQNCNDVIDEDAPGVPQFPDDDGDGFGAGTALPLCGDIDGFVLVGGDCDDGDVGVFPGAIEEATCDSVDQDCDGDLIDGSPDARWIADCDGDDATGLYEMEPDCDGAVLVCPPFPEADCDDERADEGAPIAGECPDPDACQGDDCQTPAVTGCACDSATPWSMSSWRRRR